MEPLQEANCAEAGKSNDRLDARLKCQSPNGGADICDRHVATQCRRRLAEIGRRKPDGQFQTSIEGLHESTAQGVWPTEVRALSASHCAAIARSCR